MLSFFNINSSLMRVLSAVRPPMKLYEFENK
jgi:hypothetical protein